MAFNAERTPILAGDQDTDINAVADEFRNQEARKTRKSLKTVLAPPLCKRSKLLTIVICLVLLVVIATILALVYTQKGRTSLQHKTVQTECGLVEGLTESLEGSSAFVFKGIPYAVPPVKDLRWKPPQPLKPNKGCWKGALKAHKFKSACSQLDFFNGWKEKGNENCLYLNVWTPKIENSVKLPVMVWIHGGYLTAGSANDPGYSPNVEFVSKMNIVAVSMNYRLNAFGFLALDALSNQSISNTSGNYGFMDQILALQWVKKNIARFGGDPNKVTVVGQSSGGTSIYGLLASKQANGLFQRAIAMSGSAVYNKTTREASRDNEIFLRRSNCTRKTDKDTLACIYNLNQSVILNAIPWKQYPYWEMADLLDMPKKGLFDGALCVVDGVVVDSPPGMLSTYPAMPHRIEVMIGTTAQEIDVLPVRNFRKKELSDFVTFMSERLGPFSSKLPDRAINLYKRLLNSTFPHLLYTTIATDIRTTCPNNILSSNLSSAANLDVYRYIVSNTPSTPANFYLKYLSDYSPHMWDSSALFGFHGIPHNYIPGKRDTLFKETIRKEFLHFMNSGRPANQNWKTYPVHTGVFRNDGLTIEDAYNKKGCELWNEFNLFPYGWIN